MIILGIDQSTAVASIALLEDARVVSETTWEDSPLHNRHLFSMLPRFLREAGVTPDRMDLLAVGLGPGSFAGLRNSLAGAQGLALPDGKPVFGVGSAEALAFDVGREHGVTRVAVIGDARRGRLWAAVFRVTPDGVDVLRACFLTTPDDLPRELEPGMIVVTPDWNRIGDALKRIVPAGVVLEERSVTPRARAVAVLAAARHRAGRASPSLLPIYLHPPVFVEPKFPA